MSSRRHAYEPEPLKRYTVPRYPSYLDPDPTLYPVPVPYPFRTGAISAFAGLGLATAALSTAEGANEPVGVASNTFPLSFSGLPHQTSPYGTGAPSYIEDTVARKVIDKVFGSEGIKLERGYSYDTNGLAFVADGYNRKLKIGYVFAGWTTLEQDAIISWRTREKDVDGPLSKEQIVGRLQWLTSFVGADIKKEIEEIGKMEDLEKMRPAYERLSEKIGKTKLSLAEARILEKRAEEKKEYIAVISQYDRRFVTSRWGGLSPEAVDVERKRIKALKTAKEREDAWRDAEERAADDGLKALEQAVRQYIQWARSQGVQ